MFIGIKEYIYFKTTEMSGQKQQGNPSFKEKIIQLLELPSKFILGSTLIIMSALQSRAQERELYKILQNMKNDGEINAEARLQLLQCVDLFTSSKSVQCPIMIREYKPKQKSEAYEIGLIINGQYTWSQAMGRIRNHLKIDANTSISFFCGKIVLDNGPVIDFYQQHKHEDDILYIQYLRLQSYG